MAPLAAKHNTVATEIVDIAPNRLPTDLLVAHITQKVHSTIDHLQSGLARQMSRAAVRFIIETDPPIVAEEASQITVGRTLPYPTGTLVGENAVALGHPTSPRIEYWISKVAN